MEKIERAVVISDLHLGNENSLFFHEDQQRFINVMNWIIRQLKDLEKIDELILLGDFLDLSLAPLDVLYENLRNFFVYLSQLENIVGIYFIPGNHDHHFWIELVEQDVVIERIKSNKSLPSDTERMRERPTREKFIDYFVDRKYPNGFKEVIIPYLWPEDKKRPEIFVKYPNHLRQIGKKHYFFTHGHFLEDLFTPLEYLIEAGCLEELEAFSIMWLEAFDYYLGHSGRLSQKVRDIVKHYKGEEKKKLDKTINEALKVFKKKTRIWKVWIWMIKKIIMCLVWKKRGEDIITHESGLRGKGFSKELEEKIRWYVDIFVLDRYIKGKHGFNKSIKHPFTFIFGHTHTPFEEDECGSRFRKTIIRDEEYKLFNTGGWTIYKEGIHGIAGILIIDSQECKWVLYQ